MRFALINNERSEAKHGARGICPVCSEPVTAKCGNIKIHHWSHLSKTKCDKWWEPETEWHRSWKTNFPNTWQEVVLRDEQTSEKHIADIKTSHGLVVEFQHSYINGQERHEREKFYKNMVWIVDGMRLKRDVHRFLDGIVNFRSTPLKGYFLVSFPGEYFPHYWTTSTVPVIFDFRVIDEILCERDEDATELQKYFEGLWCLLPGRAERHAILVGLRREDFIEKVLKEQQLLPVDLLLNEFSNFLKQERKQKDVRDEHRYKSHKQYRRFRF